MLRVGMLNYPGAGGRPVGKVNALHRCSAAGCASPECSAPHAVFCTRVQKKEQAKQASRNAYSCMGRARIYARASVQTF